MSWLKTADNNDDVNDKVSTEQLLAEALSQLLDRLTEHGSIDPVREEGPIADAESALAAYQAGKKEGSVVDFPDLNSQDLNRGDSGQFEEDHVLDRKKDQSVDPGSASTVPGSGADCSPGIPTGLV